MKGLVVGLLFLLSSSMISAQSILGRVVDAATGQPLAQATIEIDGSAAFVADETGKFSLAGEFTKPRSITISSVGYKTLKSYLAGTANQEFRLDRYNLLMAPVEIRATRASDNA